MSVSRNIPIVGQTGMPVASACGEGTYAGVSVSRALANHGSLSSAECPRTPGPINPTSGKSGHSPDISHPASCSETWESVHRSNCIAKRMTVRIMGRMIRRMTRTMADHVPICVANRDLPVQGYKQTTNNE